MLEVRVCPSSDNKLSVSRCGTVIGVFGRPLKGGMNRKGGYRFASFLRDNKQVNLYVHRMVAECWLDNPDNLPEVNHIDGNKLNNHVDNLEWCTSSHNKRHAIKEGLLWNLPTKGQQGFVSSKPQK